MDVRHSDPGNARATVTLAGAVSVAAGAAASATRALGRVALPLARTALHPPLVPERLHPARMVDALAERGQDALGLAGSDLERLIAACVPAVVEEVLDQINLNELVRERLDLNALVDTVDIAKIVDRVDVDAILDRVDLDAVVDRIDINAIAARIDVDSIADRIDIAKIIGRVDVDAIVAHVNLDAVVDRVDVLGMAEQVIKEIDLPEIIRDSTGSMASQVVRDARMQSIDADEAVSRFVDRILRRRSSVPGLSASSDGAGGAPMDNGHV
jgi:hypothetical protein